MIDWSRRLLDTMIVIKDRAGNPVDDRYGFGGKWDGSPDFSLYYPMTVRFTAVVVARGAAYNPACATWRIEGLHCRDLKELKGAAAAWERGQIGAALASAERELESKEPAKADEAKRVAGAIRSWAAKRRSEIEALKTALPDWAPGALARLGQQLSPSAEGKEIGALAREWEKDPAVLAARKAGPLLEALRDAAGRVRARGKPTDPEVARRSAADLQAILQLAGRLRKEFASTPAARQALDIAAGLGVKLPD